MQSTRLTYAMLFDEPDGEAPEIMKELARAGTTMVVVTHGMGLTREAGARALLMYKGAITGQNNRKDFFNVPKNPRLIDFLSKVL